MSSNHPRGSAVGHERLGPRKECMSSSLFIFFVFFAGKDNIGAARGKPGFHPKSARQVSRTVYKYEDRRMELRSKLSSSYLAYEMQFILLSERRTRVSLHNPMQNIHDSTHLFPKTPLLPALLQWAGSSNIHVFRYIRYRLARVLCSDLYVSSHTAELFALYR